MSLQLLLNIAQEKTWTVLLTFFFSSQWRHPVSTPPISRHMFCDWELLSPFSTLGCLAYLEPFSCEIRGGGKAFPGWWKERETGRKEGRVAFSSSSTCGFGGSPPLPLFLSLSLLSSCFPIGGEEMQCSVYPTWPFPANSTWMWEEKEGRK